MDRAVLCRRTSARVQRFGVRHLYLLSMVGVAIGIAACDNGSSSKHSNGSSAPPDPQIKSACANNFAAYAQTAFTYTDTAEVTVAPLVTAASTLTVTIPEDALSIGIALQGTNSNYKFIDHGILLEPSACITGPAGNVPLAFNQLDFDDPPDGLIEDDPNSLLNYQAPALFFPNDGSKRILPAGTYRFPVGGINQSFSDFESDTFQPYVYYKKASASKPTLPVNLFVAQGVRSGLNTAADALYDPEIQGAIQVLRNVYEANPDFNFRLHLNVDTVPTDYVLLSSTMEHDSLLSTYPTVRDHDSISIYVVGAIGMPGIPAGVIGLTAGLPGPFTRQGTVVSGVVTEYQNDGVGTILGFTMAHELGHYLGLFHTSQTSGDVSQIIGYDPVGDTPVCTTGQVQAAGDIDNCPDRSNLMFPYVDENPAPETTVGQGTIVGLNPAVTYRPPVANGGPDLSVPLGSDVTLDGSGSGAGMTYAWRIVSAPSGSAATLSSATAAKPTITPDVTGTFTFGLTVDDGVSTSAEDTVALTVAPQNCASEAAIVSPACGSLLTELSSAFILLDDGWIWYGDQTNSRLVRRNLYTGTTDLIVPLNGSPADLEFDEANGFLYVAVQAGTSNEVTRVDATTGTATSIPLSAKPLDLAIGNNGTVFATLDSSGVSNRPIVIVDGTNASVSTVTTGVFYDLIAFGRVGDSLYNAPNGMSGGSLHRRYQYNAVDKTFTLHSEGGTFANPKNLAASPDGSHAAFANGGGNGSGYTIYDFDGQDLANVLGQWATGPYPAAVAFSGDSNYLVATNTSEVFLFSVATHTAIYQQSLNYSDCFWGSEFKVRISPSGDRMAVLAQCKISGTPTSSKMFWFAVHPPTSP